MLKLNIFKISWSYDIIYFVGSIKKIEVVYAKNVNRVLLYFNEISLSTLEDLVEGFYYQIDFG